MERVFLPAIIKYCDRKLLNLDFDNGSDSNIASGSREHLPCLDTKYFPYETAAYQNNSATVV